MEAVRRAIGVARLTLFAGSYGTKVAVAYARRYPARVERLALDSVLDPDGPDFFTRDSIAAMPRGLESMCRTICRGVTRDPLSDVQSHALRRGCASLGTLHGVTQRRRAVRGLLEGVPESAFFPLDRTRAGSGPYVQGCLGWPRSSRPPYRETAPLPSLPVPLLAGEDDLRTPVEAAQHGGALSARRAGDRCRDRSLRPRTRPFLSAVGLRATRGTELPRRSSCARALPGPAKRSVDADASRVAQGRPRPEKVARTHRSSAGRNASDPPRCGAAGSERQSAAPLGTRDGGSDRRRAQERSLSRPR
jgi:pimeloyl-ACP methyl ester carboxylesterase